MTYICSICGAKEEHDSKFECSEITQFAEGNICHHNWIELRGFAKSPEKIEGEVKETDFEIIETNLKDEVNNEIKTLSLADQINKDKNTYLASIDSYNEVNKDLENIYSEIKNSLGLDVSLPEFKNVVMSMAKYDAKTHGYMSLINSKIAEKYSNLAFAKAMIATETILANMAGALMERTRNMGDDPEGDNNLKLAAPAMKFYREAIDMMRDLKKEMVIPEVDRKLNDMRANREEEKQIELSQEDIQALLKLANQSTEENNETQN